MKQDNQKDGILIIMSLGLGDLFFALPAIKAIKENYPDKAITLVTNAQNAEFAPLIPEISHTLAYSNKNVLDLIKLIKKLRGCTFEKAFVLNPVFKGSLLAWFSKIPIRVGYLRDYERKQTIFGLGDVLLTDRYVPEEKKMHEAERYLDLLRMNGLMIHKDALTPRIHLTEAHREFGAMYAEKVKGRRRGPTVMINLGAAWEMRRWPVDRWSQIGDWLIQNYDALVIFVGGKQEREFSDKVMTAMHYPVKNAVGELTLVQLAGLLTAADLFLTHDTGVLHLASVLHVPTIALFGPGDIQKVRPMSPQTRVLRHDLPCTPCKYQYSRKCESNLCIQDIHVPEVQEEVFKVFDEGSGILNVLQHNGVEHGKKKILYLQSTSEIGGSDITLLRTMEALDKEKFELHLLIPQEGPLTEAFKKVGCKVHYLPSMLKLTKRKGIFYLIKYLLGYLPAVFRIKKLIQDQNIDLVHTNVIHNLYGFLAAFWAGKPHVWHIREIVVQSRVLKTVETFLVRNFSSRFLVMSNAMAEAFLGKNRGFPANVTKLYDGINLKQFSAEISGNRIREELGIGREEFLAGIVCRLDPWKGIDLFLEAAAKVHAKAPKVRFLVCGGEIEGHEGYEERLKTKAEKLGLKESVIFSGWKYQGADIPEVYRALNVSVQCPVHPEPYGLTNIEAMASQIPIVTFNRGGAAEVCLNHKTAILVPADDVDAVAEGILTIHGDPEQSQEMGIAGRRRAESLFNYMKCTRRLERIYEEILEPRK